MSKPAWSIVIVALAVGFVGASQDSPYEKVLQQAVDSISTIGTTLKTITDEDSAGAAKPVLRKSANGFFDARARAAKMQPPEKDEKARLEKQFKTKLEKAMKAMFEEIRRVELIPGGKDALKEIAGVLKKDSK
ncbi:MAG: hypothetical protein EXR98_15510 [Gemmataceae bacterium]|nr:hypothetical protein [Gemmataceae bacterium]